MRRLALAAALLSCLAAPALADPAVRVVDPWLREAPPTAKVLAAYARLSNPSGQADALIDVKSEAADRVEIHTMAMEGGMMRMRRIPSLAVPARGEAILAPGGAHLMIYGPKRSLREGETVPMTFVFRRGGRVQLDVPVRKYRS